MANEKKEKKQRIRKERTYSPRGIASELKQVEWPGFKGLMKSSGLVILFTVLFGLYFFVCELVAGGLLQVIVG